MHDRPKKSSPTPGKRLEEAWTGLLARLRSLGGLTLGYSGGIDSRFLALAALRAGVAPDLVHASGPHVPRSETGFALDWATSQGLSVRVLRLDPLALPEVARGDRERCRVCKFFLFRHIQDGARGPVCDGSNASDQALHRPGLAALRELGVLSPLAEAGLAKEDIRVLARWQGLARPEQPSRACLLTRLPYFMPPTKALLARLAAGEEIVERVLGQAGMTELPFRLRVPEPDRFELHLGQEHVPQDLVGTLEQRLMKAGFPCSPVCAVPQLSGYFDAMWKTRKS